MSVSLEPFPTAAHEPRAGAGSRLRPWRIGAPFAAVVVLARLFILRLPLTPDEGGYLLAASQWHHGTSTYGAAFVDRPPLLMAVYALADLLGGGPALRVIGVLAALVAVLVAGRIGGRLAAGAAAVLVITPLFGTTNVDGELLALPLVLGGLLALLQAVAPEERRPGRSAAWAGALAAAAFLVKQDMVDVFVGAAGVCAVLALGRRRQHASLLMRRFAAGALATGALVLGLGWWRGSSPARLWDALVSFRLQAGAVISAHGSAAGGTTDRLHLLVQALVLSGAPLLALVALFAAGRPVLGIREDRPWGMDLRSVALPVLAWESAGVLLGGSYWLHYLIALVPGLVLLVSAVPARSATYPRRWPRCLVAAALVVAALSSSVAFGHLIVHRPSMTSDARVSAYLSAHRQDGDTAVVAFGHPDIVYDAGMTSPYEHLWSLSVRVRDPRLAELIALMEQPRGPQWIVVAGASLGTWGVDATAADQVLRQHYRLAATQGEWRVFERE